MKTAIEWLLNEQHLLNIDDSLSKMQYLSKRKKMEKQAIEMMKDQIIAAGNFLPHDEQNEIKTPEQYYNQTYNN